MFFQSEENMPSATVVIACGHSDHSRLWAPRLRDCGYRCEEVFDVALLRDRLREFPDLLVLDWTLIAGASPSLQEDIERDCLAAEIPCLACQFPGNSGSLPSWVGACLHRPDDPDELIDKVASQLTINRLMQDLNLANEKLIAKQFQLDESLKSAAQIQKSLVPTSTPESAHVTFSWQFLPCEKVGGDLFNIHWLDESTLMVYVLDVSGHGISSAMVTVSVSQALSAQSGQLLKRHSDLPPFYEIVPPDEVLARLDHEYPYERFDMFFSIFYMLVDIETGRVRYSNAAHPPPLLIRENGPMELLDAGGTIIGLDGMVPFEEGQTVLHPGDRLFLYTDGIPEAASSAGDFFGDHRLRELLQGGAGQPLGVACQQVVDAVHEFCGERPAQDDITLLGIEFQ